VLIASVIGSGILTWGIPLLVLVLVIVYWAVVVRRHGEL
jgi:cytochrome c-type biogenesis protein CcmH/NrfF